jgi:hypothetical protein
LARWSERPRLCPLLTFPTHHLRSSFSFHPLILPTPHKPAPLTPRFGCVLLPDEPENVAEGFDPENAFEAAAEGSGSWYDRANQRRMLRLWGLSLGMTLDLLAHLPSASPSPRIWESEEKLLSPGREPKTPVTVTSSFDEKWDAARRALDRERATSASASGSASASTPGSAGSAASPAVSHLNGNGNGNGNANPLGSLTSRGGLSPLTTQQQPGEGHAHAQNGQAHLAVAGQGGASGAGLTRQASLGRRIDARTFKGKKRGVGPGVTAVFPRFSYPDVNFWIWVFGRRYRRVVQGWEASVTGKGRATDRR